MKATIILTFIFLNIYCLGFSQAIQLHKSGTPVSVSTFFYNTINGKKVKNNTYVDFRYKKDGLLINFTCSDDKFVKNNNYTENNSPMWNQEVFEIFIAAGSKIPEKYFEFEINPNNAMFGALITNHDGSGSNNKLIYIDINKNGIQHHAKIIGNKWQGTIFLPFAVIGNSNKYMFNLFRVVSLVHHTNSKKWKCTSESCSYQALNPTMKNPTPQFHIPEKFLPLTVVI